MQLVRPDAGAQPLAAEIVGRVYVSFSERFRRFSRSAGIIPSNPRLLRTQSVSRLCRFSVPLLLRPLLGASEGRFRQRPATPEDGGHGLASSRAVERFRSAANMRAA